MIKHLWKYIAILTVCLGSLLLTQREHKETKEDTLTKISSRKEIDCGYFTWAPYVIKDPNTGALSGINYDIMEEIGKSMGVKINWKEEVSAGTAIEGLNTKRYDVMCATLWPDTARLNNSLMSDAEFYSTIYVVVRQNDTRFDGKMDAVNHPDVTIAGIDGDVTFTIAKEKFPQAKLLALPQSASGSELLENLAAKKADVVLLDKGSISDYNRMNANGVRLANGLSPVATFPETLVVRKGEDRLHQELNKQIKALKSRGFMALTIKKYEAYGYTLGE